MWIPVAGGGGGSSRTPNKISVAVFGGDSVARVGLSMLSMARDASLWVTWAVLAGLIKPSLSINPD